MLLTGAVVCLTRPRRTLTVDNWPKELELQTDFLQRVFSNTQNVLRVVELGSSLVMTTEALEPLVGLRALHSLTLRKMPKIKVRVHLRFNDSVF